MVLSCEPTSAKDVTKVEGLLLGAANLTGGYVGARMAIARGTGFIRVVFLVVVSALILKVGADTLGSLLG